MIISNSAIIVFDTNAPIETDPAWWNTVAQMQFVEVDGDSIDAEGGVSNLNLIVGLLYGELPAPKPRDGYTFTGWRTGRNGTGRQITAESIVEAGDNGIYADWATNIYVVAYNANGGEG